MSVYFQAAAFAGPFYIGLGTGSLPEGRLSTLADVDEVTGTGYARKSVTRTASAVNGWTLVDNVVTSPTLTWNNTGLDPAVAWSDADYMFLTLSPSGLTAPTTFFGSKQITTLSLKGGESESYTFAFSLYDVSS